MAGAGAMAAANASFLSDPGTQNYNRIAPSGDSRCGIRIATDRDVDEIEGTGVYTDRADWLEASGTASNYEVRATLDSGTLSSATATGSYLALSSSREWYTDDIESADLTISIRHATNTTDEISFSVQLISDNSPI